MKLPMLLLIFATNFVMLGMKTYPALAEAPKTPKIAFWADREGTRDIYLMNPDGSQQEKNNTPPRTRLHACLVTIRRTDPLRL